MAQGEGRAKAACYYYCLKITLRVSILIPVRTFQILENLPELLV